ncbi:hypothetical protein [uncultured Marixanthomonas sp.]|uniref:hypothetical protein n=1 Tax=uncultured Marixanthomonas sp. TaxID=757245 RepID=UPI0030DCEBC8|tara:strand:- start:307027 stop:307995 length:969 start_codon:yes stop_codon:yes gene_type:complete
MKRNLLSLLSLLIVVTVYSQVGINTVSPKATLDINGNPSVVSEMDGIIPPRLTGNELNNKTYTTDQVGALVYITAPRTDPDNSQTGLVTDTGYYFFNGTNWETVGEVANGVYGDVKQGFQGVDHNGWVKLDGRNISSLTATQQAQATALGFTGTLPNATNSYLSQNGTALGSISSSNQKTIAQEQLPDITPTVSVNAASAGTPTGSVNVNSTRSTMSSNGTHTHSLNMVEKDDGNFSNGDGQYPTGDNEKYAGDDHYVSTQSSGNHSHTMNTHAHSASFSGNTMNGHGHTASASSINGGVTQQTLDITPKTLSVNTFIYLGG